MAALRSGAGLVTVATPASCLPIVAGMGAEYMTLALEELADGTAAGAAADTVLDARHDVIAVGPGLGTGPEQLAFVQALLERSRTPLVLDADALTVLAGRADALRGTPDRPVIITPHPGEMARLTGTSVADVQRHRIETARDFATAPPRLRDPQGVPDADRHARRASSTSIPPATRAWPPAGRATSSPAWSRDGWRRASAPRRRACWRVYLHGAAGDLAAAEHGEVAMTAGDIVAHIGEATRELASPTRAAPREP